MTPTRELPGGYIEVGRVVDDSGDRFIMVPAKDSEPVTKPLSGDKCQAIRFKEKHLIWLVERLLDQTDRDSFEWEREDES